MSGQLKSGGGEWMIPIRPYGAGQVHAVLKWAKVGLFYSFIAFVFHIFLHFLSFFFVNRTVNPGIHNSKFIFQTQHFTILLKPKTETLSFFILKRLPFAGLCQSLPGSLFTYFALRNEYRVELIVSQTGSNTGWQIFHRLSMPMQIIFSESGIPSWFTQPVRLFTGYGAKQ